MVDLNREVRLPGPLGKRHGDGGDPARKGHINFVSEEGPHAGRAVAVVAAVIALVVIAKFGVVDVLAAAGAKEAELAQARSELAQMQERAAGFDEVERAWRAAGLDGAGDILWMLRLVERDVPAGVIAVSAAPGGIDLTVRAATLDELGRMADRLRDDDAVADVEIGSAKGASEVTATMHVTLADGAGEDGR